MLIDLIIALALWLSGFYIFGRFITPGWKITGKFLFYMVMATLFSYLITHWSLIWIIGHPLFGIGGHVWWCHKYNINWLTCQPREKYLQLRPWAINDGFKNKTNKQNALKT